jgi:hypothetical protein
MHVKAHICSGPERMEEKSKMKHAVSTVTLNACYFVFCAFPPALPHRHRVNQAENLRRSDRIIRAEFYGTIFPDEKYGEFSLSHIKLAFHLRFHPFRQRCIAQPTFPIFE